jgi:hypothetical protein
MSQRRLHSTMNRAPQNASHDNVTEMQREEIRHRDEWQLTRSTTLSIMPRFPAVHGIGGKGDKMGASKLSYYNRRTFADVVAEDVCSKDAWLLDTKLIRSHSLAQGCIVVTVNLDWSDYDCRKQSIVKTVFLFSCYAR